MKPEYSQQNVYDALKDRLKFIFEEFDNIYLSFSWRKDEWSIVKSGSGLSK